MGSYHIVQENRRPPHQGHSASPKAIDAQVRDVCARGGAGIERLDVSKLRRRSSGAGASGLRARGPGDIAAASVVARVMALQTSNAAAERDVGHTSPSWMT